MKQELENFVQFVRNPQSEADRKLRNIFLIGGAVKLFMVPALWIIDSYIPLSDNTGSEITPLLALKVSVRVAALAADAVPWIVLIGGILYHRYGNWSHERINASVVNDVERKRF